jgi:hypothetical protein
VDKTDTGGCRGKISDAGGVGGLDHLREDFSEKRTEMIGFSISTVHSPGNICRMERRISDQIDLAKFLIPTPIRLPIN